MVTFLISGTHPRPLRYGKPIHITERRRMIVLVRAANTVQRQLSLEEIFMQENESIKNLYQRGVFRRV
jgi:hypothetical protein